MLIFKGNGVNLRERKVTSKMYMDESVKAWLDQGETKSVKIGKGIRWWHCLSPILCNSCSDGSVSRLQNRTQVIRTVKYADDLMLLAKEEMVLQAFIKRLFETGRRYGMEMNVDKLK